MPENADSKRARAEALFKRKQEIKVDAPKAVEEYCAAQEAVLARMHQLRRMRLAREAKRKEQEHLDCLYSS